MECSLVCFGQRAMSRLHSRVVAGRECRRGRHGAYPFGVVFSRRRGSYFLTYSPTYFYEQTIFKFKGCLKSNLSRSPNGANAVKINNHDYAHLGGGPLPGYPGCPPPPPGGPRGPLSKPEPKRRNLERIQYYIQLFWKKSILDSQSACVSTVPGRVDVGSVGGGRRVDHVDDDAHDEGDGEEGERRLGEGRGGGPGMR